MSVLLIFSVFCGVLCCFFIVMFFFILCLVFPMLPVALDCLHPVSCVPNAASGSGLSSSCVLCAQCCRWLWIVFVLCLVCPMLPVALDCLHPVSCVHNAASGSGLSSSCVLCAQCCRWLWIVFILCLVCPMLPVALDCPFFIASSVFFNVYLLTRVLHLGQTYTCTAL